jgi:hypothetical protein
VVEKGKESEYRLAASRKQGFVFALDLACPGS